jgi:amidase
MIDPEHIAFSSATQLAAAIRSGEVTASAVVETLLARIKAHNPGLNAIVTVCRESALRRAAEADRALDSGQVWGPLHGVPFTAKDSLETAGVRTTVSYAPLEGYVPEQDATVVSRLKSAGGILLGKTNTPELAGDVQTNSPIFGLARNPWDPERTPGGSTGGGAAALAAGFTPLELGSDSGGSIRIPALFCGVCGIKPSERLVSSAGHIPDLPGQPKSGRHLSVVGPLARDAGDLRLALRLIAGPDPRDPSVAPISMNWREAASPEPLRIAWCDGLEGLPVSADMRARIRGCATLLADAGCQMVETQPESFDYMRALEVYGDILGTESALNMGLPQRASRLLSFTLLHRRDPSAVHIGLASRLSARRYLRALAERDALIQKLEGFMAGCDAFLCPAGATPAFTHRRPTGVRPPPPIVVDERPIPYWIAAAAHTMVFNLTGSPAMVLPATSHQGRLPFGVQLVGRRWQDGALIAVATRIEALLGGFRPPPLFAPVG